MSILSDSRRPAIASLLLAATLTFPLEAKQKQEPYNCTSEVYFYLDVSESLTTDQKIELARFFSSKETSDSLFSISKTVRIIPFSGILGPEIEIDPDRPAEAVALAEREADSLDKNRSDLIHVIEDIRKRVAKRNLGPNHIYIIASDFQHDATPPPDDSESYKKDRKDWRERFKGLSLMHERLASNTRPRFLLLPRPGAKSDLASEVIRGLQRLVDYENILSPLSSNQPVAISIARHYKPVAITRTLTRRGDSIDVSGVATNYSCSNLKDLTFKIGDAKGGQPRTLHIPVMNPGDSQTLTSTIDLSSLLPGARENPDVILNVFPTQRPDESIATLETNIQPFLFFESLTVSPAGRLGDGGLLEATIQRNLFFPEDPKEVTVTLYGRPLTPASDGRVSIPLSSDQGRRHERSKAKVDLDPKFWPAVCGAHDPMSLHLRFEVTSSSPDRDLILQKGGRAFEVEFFSDDSDSFEDLLRHSSAPTLITLILTSLIILARKDRDLERLEVVFGATAGVVFSMFFIAHRNAEISRYIDWTMYGFGAKAVAVSILGLFLIMSILTIKNHTLFPAHDHAQIRADVIYHSEAIRTGAKIRSRFRKRRLWRRSILFHLLRLIIYTLMIAAPLSIGYCVWKSDAPKDCQLTFRDTLTATDVF